MKILLQTLATIVCFIFSFNANAEGVSLWKLEINYLEVSKQAVSVPSVKLLDPPYISFHLKVKIIGVIDQSAEEISKVLEVAQILDASLEPFSSHGAHYGLELGVNKWLLIYRDHSNRYEIGMAEEVNGLIFLKKDRRYYKSSTFPSVEAMITKFLRESVK